MGQSLFHVLSIKIAQTQSAHSLIFDKILQSIEILRIVVLR